ncbi:aminomethyltransferase family protein [Salipiger aestuarii]|uniref:Heterotetrameric sarcosine oxidase gamma subunit n=1 Tax=Salipiger aestuarii TaxID=568098 RepID=A0A327YAI9_9RHOB|nr:sarcosine oxidase subunit gamma [Salipiger aestuarii]EIE50001.1 sarcosine oxidase gamma subunit [Citreicella sp. 357]KAA8611469.1 sarcosine oxidase subunit gamma [Salipiger aestuarii]KAB2541019.1 sarcosine oxidase subunit gamma [Salipiger aestuarii]RAK15519.1 heterotetrameric sarcosine oxidase gamma subunit [Salipiger aestuarii]
MNAPILAEVPLAHSAAATIRRAAPRARASLRLRGDLAPFEAALGLTLSGRLGSRADAGPREGLRLGPDEWMLHTTPDDLATVTSALAPLYADHPHSLVDVSGREVTVVIEGPRAAELLTIGCARDIDAIPDGAARRTVFDGAAVILWRDSATRFRIDVWNSFAPHLLDLLVIGTRELAAETS